METQETGTLPASQCSHLCFLAGQQPGYVSPSCRSNTKSTLVGKKLQLTLPITSPIPLV